MLIDYLQQMMGDAIDLAAPRRYRASQHSAFGLITLEAATLALPPRSTAGSHERVPGS